MTRIASSNNSINALQQTLRAEQSAPQAALSEINQVDLGLDDYLQHNPEAMRFLAMAGVSLPSSDQSQQQLGVLNFMSAQQGLTDSSYLYAEQADAIPADIRDKSIFSLEAQLEKYAQNIARAEQSGGLFSLDDADTLALEQLVSLMLIFGVPPEQIDQQLAESLGQYGGWSGPEGGYSAAPGPLENIPSAGRWSDLPEGGSASERINSAYVPEQGAAPQGYGYNANQLRRVVPGLSASRAAKITPHLNAAMHEAGISSKKEQAAFVAQLAHESGGFKYFEELASGKAYEGRRDLGNTRRGDGRRFKGRGPIQLTGRANYRKAGKALGIDLEHNPKLASRTDVGFRTAAWYWKTRGVGKAARAGNFRKATKLINGGYNGYADRLRYYRRALVA